MKTGRNISYDLLKCIAIYLVCLHHYGTLNDDVILNAQPTVYLTYFFHGLASVGVPLFIMVNGALLLNRPYTLEKHLWKTGVLGVLYLAWSAITLIIEAPVFGDHYTAGAFLKAVYFSKQNRTNHLWFLPALIYIYLLFPFIKALYDKNDRRFTAYLFILVFAFTFGSKLLDDAFAAIAYITKHPSINSLPVKYWLWFNPFPVFFSYALFYFISGGWLANNRQKVKVGKKVLITIFLVGWVLLFVYGLVRTKLHKSVYDTVWNGYDSIMTLAMSIALFLLCSGVTIDNEKIKRQIEILGQNTLGIYFIHVPFGVWLTRYYMRLSISKYFVVDLLYAFLVMMLSLMLALIIRRIPFVNRLLKV
jgi:surface polysaccharide O-acyltransferase-like enzyme